MSPAASPAPARFRPQSQAAAEAALAAVAATFRVQAEPPETRTTTYLDTFDWRLHRAGGTLAAEPLRGGGVTLRWSGLGGRPRRHLRAARVPAFPTDLAPGPFRDALAEITWVRRLLPLATLAAESAETRVLDERDKTVARLRFTAAGRALAGDAAPPAGGGEPLAPSLELLPVRGYPEAGEHLAALLAATPELAPADGSELGELLAAVGREPRDYSSKLALSLDPAMRADQAAHAIHRTLLATLEANEEGVRRDLDSEFLHDFRVAVRRTRSALGQIKGVYPPAVRERFAGELSWLGRATGPTRDLDVHRLEMDGYRAELPAAVRPHLEPLGAYLERHQREEHARLVEALDSPRYGELVAAWSAFLAAEPPGGADAPSAGRPVREVASERIWRAWRRLRKRGRRLDDSSPDAALHRLRIDAKKLRYLIEFFRSLYDPGELGKPLRALKKLQDNLGAFNDLAVQRRALGRFAEGMAAEGAAPPATLLAMGRLQTVLEERHRDERRRFARRFARLTRGRTAKHLGTLFAPGGERA